MKNLIIKSVFLTFSLLAFDQEAHCAMSRPLTPMNYIEAALGAARGILACTSHFHKNSDSSKAKTIHSATKITRLMHEILTIINHPGETNYASAFWAAFNASDLCFDFFKGNDSALDEEEVDLSQEQEEKIAAVMQRYFFPFFESGTAFYSALNNGQTPEDILMRRRMRAFCWLSQALSLYMDHRNSKAALLLLLGACSEVALSLDAQPELLVQNRPIRQPGQTPQQNIVHQNQPQYALPLQANLTLPGEQITEAERRHRENLRRHNYLRFHGAENSQAEQDALWQEIQEYENRPRPYVWD